jgi:general secretion pathway protein M
MQALQQRLATMEPRERTVLLIGVVFTILVLGYVVIWEPWHQSLDRLRTQVPQKTVDLEWMQKQAKSIQPLLKRSKNKRPGDNIPLLSVVEKSAEQAKIRNVIRRMSPGADSEVKVWITDAEFDKWLQWLEQLRKQGVEVSAANINRSKEGRVGIRLTLVR